MASKFCQIEQLGIHTIYGNLTLCDLRGPEKNLKQRTFAWSCSAYHTHLLSAFSDKGQVL